MHAGNPAPDLPPYSLDVQAWTLAKTLKPSAWNSSKRKAASPCADRKPPQSGPPPWWLLPAMKLMSLDFFSHLDRVRNSATLTASLYREAAARCLVVPQPSLELLRQLLARFEAETFGMRAGPAAANPDAALENELSHRGLDAYQPAYQALHLLRRLRTRGRLGHCPERFALAQRNYPPRSPRRFSPSTFILPARNNSRNARNTLK